MEPNQRTNKSCRLNAFRDSLQDIFLIDKFFQVLLNVQSKQDMRKVCDINFNYTYRLHLLLLIRINFHKYLIDREP